jgi:hypothetical protein
VELVTLSLLVGPKGFSGEYGLDRATVGAISQFLVEQRGTVSVSFLPIQFYVSN